MHADQNWYLIQTRSRQEARALEHLERQGFHCFLPWWQQEQVRQGRRVSLSVPLFPGYLFIRLQDAGQSWAPIRSTRGVLRLVSFGSPHPLSIEDGLVETLRIRSLMQKEQGETLFQPGDRVRVTDGPFRDVEAIFLRPDGDERVVLLMRLLQQEQTMRVPVAQVIRA